MKPSALQLPSNKKFGYFFSTVFLIISAYFFLNDSRHLFYVFAFLTLIFLTLTIFKSKFLYPLNLLWMRFGVLIGMIVSPIVLGVIFFGLFTPISIIMKLIGRDELGLKISNRDSFWKERNDIENDSGTFFNQF